MINHANCLKLIKSLSRAVQKFRHYFSQHLKFAPLWCRISKLYCGENSPELLTIRRQIDITTYQLLFFLSDTSLCLFGDELFGSKRQGYLWWRWACSHPTPISDGNTVNTSHMQLFDTRVMLKWSNWIDHSISVTLSTLACIDPGFLFRFSCWITEVFSFFFYQYPFCALIKEQWTCHVIFMPISINYYFQICCRCGGKPHLPLKATDWVFCHV